MKNINAYRRHQDGTICRVMIYQDGEIYLNGDGHALEPTGEKVALKGWDHDQADKYKMVGGGLVTYLIPKIN